MTNSEIELSEFFTFLSPPDHKAHSANFTKIIK